MNSKDSAESPAESSPPSTTGPPPGSDPKLVVKVSGWKFAVAGMFAGMIGMAILVLIYAIVPAQWGFSIQVKTEVAEIVLQPDTETYWQIDGALLCARSELDIPVKYRLETIPNPCGSDVWQAWKISEPEQAIKLNGGTSTFMQSMADGSYAMSLRASASDSLGTLSIIGIAEDIEVGSALNLIWPAKDIPSRDFPFAGKTILGRAVMWSDSRLLQSGQIKVFTSDDSADNRTQVDEADLMLGDEVRLGEPQPGQSWPKGFIHISPDEEMLQVVVFGQTESMRIERFGESGYDFKPRLITGLFAKLLSNPKIALWGSILGIYITLILTLQPFIKEEKDSTPTIGIVNRVIRWFHKKA